MLTSSASTSPWQCVEIEGPPIRAPFLGRQTGRDAHHERGTTDVRGYFRHSQGKHRRHVST